MSMSLLSTVRCVVFDIDDTLYLERDYVRSGFNAVDAVVAERFAVTGFGERAWEAFERGVRGTIFDAALEQCGVAASEADVSALVGDYRQHAPNITLLDDAAECLSRLAGSFALAAISDGPLDSQRNKANALGLERWCDPIVLTATLGPGRGKPHVAAFEIVQRASGYRGDQCVYVGDNPTKDFQGPRALGWRTVRVRRPMGLHFAVDGPAKCDVELADLGQLAKLLGLASCGE